MSIASQHGARLFFLHVISEHVPANLRERVAHAARQEIEVVMSTARVVDLQSIDIQIKIGQSAEKIISTADQINAYLIVFGMHQDAGIKTTIPETMIEKIVRFGHQPALIITDQESDRYDNVMMGAGFLVYSRRALYRLLCLSCLGRIWISFMLYRYLFRLSCWAARHVTHCRNSTKRIYAKCGSGNGTPFIFRRALWVSSSGAEKNR